MQQLRFGFRNLREYARGIHIGRHDGKRLVRAMLAFTQTLDGAGIQRIAAEMIAANAFDRANAPLTQNLNGLRQSLGVCDDRFVRQMQ